MFNVKRVINLILFVLIVSILMSPAICKAEELVNSPWEGYESVYYPAIIEVPDIMHTNKINQLYSNNPGIFEIDRLTKPDFTFTPLSDSNPLPAAFSITPFSEGNPIPPVIPFSPHFMYAGEGLLYQGINSGGELFVPAFSAGFGGGGGGYTGLLSPDQDPGDFPPWILPYVRYDTSLGSYLNTGLNYVYDINPGSGYYPGPVFGW